MASLQQWTWKDQATGWTLRRGISWHKEYVATDSVLQPMNTLNSVVLLQERPTLLLKNVLKFHPATHSPSDETVGKLQFYSVLLVTKPTG